MVSLGARLVPSLLMRDVATTVAFYERLGFQLTGLDSQLPRATWVEVHRDGVVLQFHSDPPHGTPPEPVLSGTLYLFPSSVDEIADELRRAGLELAWGPEDMDYGMRECAIQDPNGYFIAFTEPVRRR